MDEIDPAGLPRNLTHEEIGILARLAFHSPLSEKWIRIAKLLTPEQKVRINEKMDSFKTTKSTRTKAPIDGQGMSEETWNEIKERQEFEKFYGNMGSPWNGI